MESRKIANPLKSLMLNLYYPAVTGGAFVLELNRIALHKPLSHALKDIGAWYGAVFVVFFSACFLASSLLSDKEYGARVFFFDLGEAVLIFCIFFALGLCNTSKIEAPHLRAVYSCMALLMLAQQFWPLPKGDKVSKYLRYSRLTVFTVAVLGSWILPQNQIFAVIMLIFVAAGVFYYLLVLKYRLRA